MPASARQLVVLGVALVLGVAGISSCSPATTPAVTVSPPSATASNDATGSTSSSAAPSDSATIEPTPTPSPIPVPAPAPPLAGKVIVVDPGHAGRYSASLARQVPAGNGRTKACNTAGAEAPDGYEEHAFNFDTAQRLANILGERGATVVMTRADDTSIGPCVDERAAIGNRAGADIVLSIHADGAPSAGRGFHVIHSTAMIGGQVAVDRSAALALAVVAAVEGTGMPRSTYVGQGTGLSPRDDIAGLNLSKAPGIMLEAGNLANRNDLALLESPEFRQQLAKALADAAQRALATG